ncbi:MAG: hypothetical protein J2P50_17320 [Hyphomicrobiaceae bacterium]|nr:hypothetical protein [Hyphomicrobiaceae bacterium]
MMRAVVLVVCLAAAGGIAVYTHHSRPDSGEQVYTLPSRSPEPSRPLTPGRPTEPSGPSTPAAPTKVIDPSDRAALAREIQRELQRVGCYTGEINGVWTTSSRLGMKAFIERVNAALPIDNPDPVLLGLVQSHRDRACRVCPQGQTATGTGSGTDTCVPNAVLATAKKPADASPAADKPGSAPPAAGSATLTLTTPSAAPKPDPRRADPRASGSGTVRPARSPATTDPSSEPVPPEGMVRERRPRPSAETPPPSQPKVVRNILKALGF